MDLKLSNKRKQLEEEGVNKVSLEEYEIYNAERSASPNVRLMCNVNVVCDGSLYNPITEIVEMDGSEHKKAPKMGTSGVSSDISSDTINFGADMFDLPSLRVSTQPFLENQDKSTKNFRVNEEHYVKTVKDYWFKGHVGGFTSVKGLISKFGRNEYKSLEKTYEKKFVRNDSWFGFMNPVSMRYENKTLADYDKGEGLISGIPGKFLEMSPEKKLYSYVPVYSKINKQLEYNWLTYVTYPYKNVYDTDYLNKIGGTNAETNLERYGLSIWFIDEDDSEITYFRTLLRNGFKVGDIVNVYSGSTASGALSTERIIEGYEVVEKPDEYTFALNMGGKKFFNWSGDVPDTEEDTTEETVRYENKNNRIKKLYYRGESVYSKEATYNYDGPNNGLSVVRVDNQAECFYYIRVFKPFPNRPIVTQNSFSKNPFGIDSASVLFIDDIDLSSHVDNLGRPLSDIFLTSVKNNKGYGHWYSFNDVKQNTATTIEGSASLGDTIEESRVFGEVNGSFVMDDCVCGENDTSHENSIKNLATSNGRVVLTERFTTTYSEVNDLEFYGDLCEYSINSFSERSLQSFMHRFNTAQRESYLKSTNFLIKQSMIAEDTSPNLVNGEATPIRYSPSVNGIVKKKSKWLSGCTNGYYYQPHQRIRVRTYALDLTYKDAIRYKVLRNLGSGVNTFTYDKLATSGYSCTISVERIDEIALNMPLVLYYQSDKKDVSEDFIFNGRMINRYNETLYEFMLDDISLRNDLATCISNFDSENNKGDIKFFVLRKPSDVPSNAILLKDRSFSYIWRELIPNGFDRDSSVEEYPFGNNAFYIEKNINIYLRRQREVSYLNENHDIITLNGEYNYLPESEDVDLVETTPSANNPENKIKEIEEC